jgi:hypothetical protein
MDRKIVKKKDRRRVFVDFCYKGEIDNLPEPSESELGHIYIAVLENSISVVGVKMENQMNG